MQNWIIILNLCIFILSRRMTTHRKSKQPIEQLKQYEQSPKQPQRQPKKLEQLREQLEQPKKS